MDKEKLEKKLDQPIYSLIDENEFFFEVVKRTERTGKRSTSVLAETNFYTKIELENKKINIKCSRNYKDYTLFKMISHERKYSSIIEGKRCVNIDDIILIKHKIEHVFALDFDLICGIGMFLLLLYLIFLEFNSVNEIVENLKNVNKEYGHFSSASSVRFEIVGVFLVSFITKMVVFFIFMLNFINNTVKCLKIKYKTNSIKKEILIPVESLFYKNSNKTVMEFINKIKSNSKIKYKKDKCLSLFIILIFALFIFVGIPLYEYRMYLPYK